MQVTPPLDRLLGGRNDRLGVKEKEAILQQVLQATKPQKKPYLPWLGAFVAAAFALAIAALLLPQNADELTPKGGGQTSAVELTCHPGTSEPCRVGERLYFRVLTPGGFLAAFAKTAAGNVVWFFPSDDTATSVALKGEFLDEASMLPAELSDNVTVHMVLSDTPLSRAQIRSLYDEGAGGHTIKLERSLRIER